MASQPQWLYVRFVPQAKPFVQSGMVELDPSMRIERYILTSEQTLRSQRQKNPALMYSALQIVKIEQAEEPLLRTALVRYDGTLPADKFCRLLMITQPLVEYAEPVLPQRLFFVPNDPLFGQQQYLQVIEAPSAWDITTGNSSVLIGISDSGVRTWHEDLRTSITLNTAEVPGNGVDDDNNGYVDDYRGYNFSWRNDNTRPDSTHHPTDGHGTSVAGIVAATQNNGKGISGIAPGCRIVPIKASPNTVDGYVLFGYESMIYAALRGCKVLNCSWGNDRQAPSPIEQSIVDYAIARDVAIVAAAGNYGSALPIYPAAYRGVLGVGETDSHGGLMSSSSYGAHCRILAPGDNAYTIGNNADNAYTIFDGTSSAAPMVSAVVGLVRSRYPQLTAMQALEHVRLSTRSVRTQNPQYADLLPGMVNARIALQRNPFTTPAIVPEQLSVQNSDGVQLQRWSVGDTLYLYVDAINVLGAGSYLQFQLTPYTSSGEQAHFITILNGKINVPSVASGQKLRIGPFVTVVGAHVTVLHFLRLAIDGIGANGTPYTDAILLPFNPTPDWVTIERDSTFLSVGDYGWLGLNTGAIMELKGKGLNFAGIGPVLYGGGVFAVHYPTEQVWSGIESDADRIDNQFAFGSNTPTGSSTTRILHDTSMRAAPIGIELEERIVVLDRVTILIRCTVRNQAETTLGNLAVGYYFDFDLTIDGDSSAVGLVLNTSSACAELIEHASQPQKIIVLVRSNDSDALLQCAGLDAAYASVNSFIDERKMEALRKGTSLQFGGLGDKSIVAGIRYPNGLSAGEQRIFDVLILAGHNRSELLDRSRRLASAHPPLILNSTIHIIPHPIDRDIVIIECEHIAGRESKWNIFSIDGSILWERYFSITPSQFPLECDILSSGVYVLQVQSGCHLGKRLLVVVR